MNKYVKPEIEVVMLCAEDVIMTSGVLPRNSLYVDGVEQEGENYGQQNLNVFS